jgi:type IV secretion system protein VirB9
MKRYIIIAVLLSTSIATAAEMERYSPPGITPTVIPAPYIQAQPPVQQVQPISTAPEFKKFNIKDKKSNSYSKKKHHKKINKKLMKPSAAIPKNSVEQSIAPTQYIDLQALFAKGKAVQVEEKKELNYVAQIEKSTQKPDDAIKDMAKTVYTHIPGSIYTMWCRKGFVTDIQLQTGESIIAVNGGDTVRWLVETTTSGGNGVPETQHVFVKPLQSDVLTNVIISTDKRIYQLKAIATENTYSPIISWTYPADEKSSMLFVQKQITKEKSEVILDEAVPPENLFFKYKIKSNAGIFADEYPWTPLKTFNDGTKTYIQTNPQMKNNESPALFVKDRNGNVNLVNYRLKNNYFIVDRLFETAELRNGTDEIVTITKEIK